MGFNRCIAITKNTKICKNAKYDKQNYCKVHLNTHMNKNKRFLVELEMNQNEDDNFSDSYLINKSNENDNFSGSYLIEKLNENDNSSLIEKSNKDVNFSNSFLIKESLNQSYRLQNEKSEILTQESNQNEKFNYNQNIDYKKELEILEMMIFIFSIISIYLLYR